MMSRRESWVLCMGDTLLPVRYHASGTCVESRSSLPLDVILVEEQIMF